MCTCSVQRTMYTNCSLYIIQCIRCTYYNVQQLFIVPSTICTNYILYGVLYTPTICLLYKIKCTSNFRYVQCTPTVRYREYNVHQLFVVHSTMYTNCSLYRVQCTPTVRCTEYNVLQLFVVQSAMYTTNYSLYRVQCTPTVRWPLGGLGNRT